MTTLTKPPDVVTTTFRASVHGVTRELVVRPFRIAGLWAHDGSWGPMLSRGSARDAAADIARRLNWPAAFVAALA